MSPFIGTRRVSLEELLERVGADASDATVTVARQMGGAGGEVQLSLLRGFHTRTVSGGRGDRHYFPAIYAYGTCTDLPVEHSGSHGSCPHDILVCVVAAEREDVWEALCEATGYEPPAEEQVDQERRKVKESILERLGANEVADRELRPCPCPAAGGWIFNESLAREVGPIVDLWTGAADWLSWYFDRRVGRVFCSETGTPDAFDTWKRRRLDPGWGKGPELPARFEKIQPLDGAELEDDCAPARGDWNQPAGHLANEARDQLMRELGEEPPWCRIHERAWEIAPQEDQPQ